MPGSRQESYLYATLLAPVAPALEVEVELEDAALEDAAEAALGLGLPLLVDDLEGEVLVGRARLEADDDELVALGAGPFGLALRKVN